MVDPEVLNGIKQMLDKSVRSKEAEEQEQEEVDDRTDIRVLKKKCITCNRLIPWADDAFSCKNNPECPARVFTFSSGKSPELLGSRIAGMIINGATKDECVAAYKAVKKLSEADIDQVFIIASEILIERFGGQKEEVEGEGIPS